MFICVIQALRQDRRAFLPYRDPDVGRHCWIRHCHQHYEHGRSLCIAVSMSTPMRSMRLRALLCRFLMAQSYAGFVVLYTWVSNSFPRPPSKRAVVVALVNAFSQLGNIAGS